jgi:predicted DNA-binding protein
MTKPKEFVARSVRIPVDLFGRLDNVAHAEGKSMARVLRDMLERGLNLYFAARAAERNQESERHAKSVVFGPQPAAHAEAVPVSGKKRIPLTIPEEYDILS